MNYREGWNHTVGNRIIWESYVKEVTRNFIVFNDGQTPGEVEVDLSYDRADVALFAVREFMSTWQFQLASGPVKEKFVGRLRTLEASQGQTLPEGYPTIEDAALQELQNNIGNQNIPQGVTPEE